MEYKIELYSDSSERIPYTLPEISFYANRALTHHAPKLPYSQTAHWHEETEFLFALEGGLEVSINETTCTLERGEGIFINARQIHFNKKVQGDYICVLLNPMMLCANVFMEQTFISPVLSNPVFAYRHLKPQQAEDRLLLDYIIQIYRTASQKDNTRILRLQSLFFSLWEALFTMMPALEESSADNPQLSVMKAMMRCVQERYAQKLSLAEIAAAGSVCKSQCCRLFHVYLHQSPIQFLTAYRLKQSAKLLLNTTDSIVDIAYTTGFSSASYFTETFRIHYGCTPREYRKQYA